MTKKSDIEDPLILPTNSEIVIRVQESGEVFNGASFSGAVFNLCTTIIGAGIMALPAVMKVLGLVLGVCIIVVVAILTEFSAGLLIKYSRAGGSKSYGAVMKDAFGTTGKKILQCCVVINNTGILVVYMIIIGDVLSGTYSGVVHHAGLLEEWFGEHWWIGRVFLLLVITLFVFFPLACLKHMDSLRYTSAIAVAMAIVFLAITIGITIYKLIHGSISMPRMFPVVTDISSVWKLFTVVPVLVTSYVFHFNVHSLHNELKNPYQIQPIIRTSLVVCSIIYFMMSFFGILIFGDSILDDVLANFDVNLGIAYSSVITGTVRLSYVLHLMLVFPLIFYPLRLNLDGILFPHSGPLVANRQRFICISIGLLIVVYLGATFIPSIWDAFQFTGATAAVCIGFVFPGTVALRDPHGIATKKDKILSILMIAIAVFSNLIAIYSDANALFS